MNKMVNGVLVTMTDAEIAEFNASLPIKTETDALNDKWHLVRNERDDLLAKTDWVVTRASETGVAETDAWKTYRQALRDITTQSNPWDITWPTKPS
tara:strand:+ start:1282 stop:1569 length:288 start_codon:yes stop_codon:yes gene_type:complete